MLKTNYQLIKELKQEIKNEEIRYKINFLTIGIGSYKARKENPDNFTNKRQISGGVLEAEYIAEIREHILNLLEKKSIDYVIKKLYQEFKELKKEDLPESILSNNLNKINNGSINNVGERLEENILKNKKLKRKIKEREKTIEDLTKKLPDLYNIIGERQTKNIFYLEADIMSGILHYEVEEQDRIKKDKYKFP